MLDEIKRSIWSQMWASIESLRAAVNACPNELYVENKRFFYLAYHTIVFLDYYSTIPLTNFVAKLPFTLIDPSNITENAVDDLLPDRDYSKTELLDYIDVIRNKCSEMISSLTEQKLLTERFIEEGVDGAMNYSWLEITLYNMRHVQHHAAQLNLLLRQHNVAAPKWIARASL